MNRAGYADGIAWDLDGYRPEPDETETIEHKGLTVEVLTWVDPTDLEWDGDFELAEGSEGWDVMVEARTTIAGHSFMGHDSLGSIWIDASHDGQRYLREEIDDVKQQALSSLEIEIARVSRGEDAQREAERAKAALAVLETLRKGEKVAP
jgi:hypothetical protein